MEEKKGVRCFRKMLFSGLLFVVLLPQSVLAVTLNFEKISQNSVSDYSGLLAGQLGPVGDSALLEIQNGTGGSARIGSVYIQHSGALLISDPETARLTLEAVGNQKVEVVRAVRAITGLDLAEAKSLVDNAPSEILFAAPIADVLAAQQKLQEAGAATGLDPLTGIPDISQYTGPPTRVVLENFGSNKINVVKAVRAITGLGLADAKALVDNVPSVIESATLSPEEIRAALEDAGASASVENNALPPPQVVLQNVGASKLEVVKAVKEVTGLGLADAKALVDNAPSVIESSTLSPREIRTALEAAGATAGIDNQILLDIMTDGIELPQTGGPATEAVTLVSFGASKIEVIKVVRAITGLGLADAKALVDNLPSIIESASLSPQEISEMLEAAGASVRIEKPGPPAPINPDYQLLLDYQGSRLNPDLAFLLGLDVEFGDLLSLLSLGDFRLGLEVIDETGTDLYAFVTAGVGPSPVPIPAMTLPFALCLGFLACLARKNRFDAGQ